MMQLPIFSQFDTRWGDRKLSPSSLTMGSWGCLLTAYTMGLHNYAISLLPDEFLDRVIAVNGLNAQGEALHSALGTAFPQLYFHSRIYTSCFPDANVFKMDIATALERVRRLMDLGQPVYFHVDNAGGDGRPDHFVVGFDYLTLKDKVVDFQINDPDGGKSMLFSSKYGDPSKKLYGYVAVIGPPVAFPDQSREEKDGQAVWKASQIVKGINVKTYARELIDTLL